MLIVVALDNTASSVREFAEAIGGGHQQDRWREASDMDSLWDRVIEELEFRVGTPHA